MYHLIVGRKRHIEMDSLTEMKQNMTPSFSVFAILCYHLSLL